MDIYDLPKENYFTKNTFQFLLPVFIKDDRQFVTLATTLNVPRDVLLC